MQMCRLTYILYTATVVSTTMMPQVSFGVTGLSQILSSSQPQQIEKRMSEMSCYRKYSATSKRAKVLSFDFHFVKYWIKIHFSPQKNFNFIPIYLNSETIQVQLAFSTKCCTFDFNYKNASTSRLRYHSIILSLQPLHDP